MGGISSVAVFAPVDQIPHGYIEAGIASRAAGRRGGVACLTIFQIGFCLGSMQVSVFERKRMGGAGAAGMAACCRAVGIRKPGGKTAWCRWVGGGAAFGEIMTDGTCGVLLGCIAMG